MKILMVVSAIFLISCMPSVYGNDHGSGDRSRAPDKSGSIYSDETWSGTLYVDDLVIEAGATVTVEPDTTLRFYDEAMIWVRGVLKVNGTEGALVRFELSSGSYWEGIIINETGTADIQNATFEGGRRYISIRGEDVRIRNVMFDQGWSGISVSGGTGHDISYVYGKYIDNVVNIYSNEGPMELYWVYGVGVTSNVVQLSNARNISLDWILASDCYRAVMIDGGCGGACANISLRRIKANQSAPITPGSSVISLLGPVRDLEIVSIDVKDIDTGFELDTSHWSNVVVSNLRSLGGVSNLFLLDQDDSGLDMEIYDSRLEADNKIFDVLSTDPDVNITAVNCNIGSGGVEVLGQACLDVSWYTNYSINDAGGRPMKGHLETYLAGGEPVQSLELHEGNASFIVPEYTMNGSGITDYRYDTVLLPDQMGAPPVIMRENHSYDMSLNIVLTVDLPPTNSLPDTIEFHEDEIFIFNHTDHFDDDGEYLVYGVSSGTELDVHMKMHDWPHLEIMSNETHWYGESWLNISATDQGDNKTWGNITVNILPVNDIAVLHLEYLNGTYVEEGSFDLGNNTTRAAYVVDIHEDSNITLLFNITDVEDDNVSLNFGPVLGEIEGLNVMPVGNFTFRFYCEPDNYGEFWQEMDILEDGEPVVKFWLFINVTPVNDAPFIDAPEDWNYTIEEGVDPVIDLEGMFGDVDSEDLTLSIAPESFGSFNGTVLTLTIPDDITEEFVDILINVSDGELLANEVLRVYLTQDVGPGPGPQDGLNVTGMEVEVAEDEWTITVYGDQGQTIYLVVEDDEGEKRSYLLEYEDGIYSVLISGDDVDEGDNIYLTDSEDGDEILPEFTRTLPELNEEKERNYWTYVMIAILAIIILAFMVFLVTRSKDLPEYEE